MAFSLWLTASHAQDVETIELSTRVVHPVVARLGNSCMIQLPVEPVATNVGDPSMWLVEKAERIVSIKPIQEAAKDTSLAIVTRQGTLNFSVHLRPEPQPHTQMVRVTRIVDDSRPLPPRQLPQESLTETLIHEIRIAQNYYALKNVQAPELRDVEQFTVLHETRNGRHSCALLQTFRFRDSRHVILHFVTQNHDETTVAFDPRRTAVHLGETFFAPLAVSLGKTILPPKASAENFLVLDGSSGLSHRQAFQILWVESTPPHEPAPTQK